MSPAPLTSDLLFAALAGTVVGAAVVAAAAFSATCFAVSRASATSASLSPPDLACCRCARSAQPAQEREQERGDRPARRAQVRADRPAPCSRCRDSGAACDNQRTDCVVGGGQGGDTPVAEPVVLRKGENHAQRKGHAQEECHAEGGSQAQGGGHAQHVNGETKGSSEEQHVNGNAKESSEEQHMNGEQRMRDAAPRMAITRCATAGGCAEVGRAAEREGGEGEGSEGNDGGLGEEGTGKQHRRKNDPYDARKRKGFLSWDDYFMAMAFLSAQRSKDPNRQVGACIVGSDHVIVGIGYNGFPRGISDDLLPWAKVGRSGAWWAKLSANNDPLETKYPYVCHAEVNAVLNRNHASALDQRLYVTMFPCNDCAKVIIQAGIKEVIFYSDKPPTRNPKDLAYAASRKLLELAGVKVSSSPPSHQPLLSSLPLAFSNPPPHCTLVSLLPCLLVSISPLYPPRILISLTTHVPSGVAAQPAADITHPYLLLKAGPGSLIEAT
ncbi:unnamed protein product [Closterium sp. Naga37s-1]|nr:unnamed protein product [Closterium sp. Naga37s-1]